MRVLPATRRVVGGVDRSRANPDHGAWLRRLRQWLFIAFAVGGVMERVDMDVPMNGAMLLQQQMWAKSRALYARVQLLARPPAIDTFAAVEVMSTCWERAPSPFNGSMAALTITV